jgi:ApeA N-terminal domain 1
MVPDWTTLADAESDIPMATLTAKEVENIQLDSSAQLYLVHAISAAFDLGSTSLRQSAKAQFKFDNLVDLDSAFDHAVDLLAAITFAADRVIEFEEVNFSHPDFKQQPNPDCKSVDLYAQRNAQADPNRKDLISGQMAFTYAQLGGVSGLAQLLAVIQQNRGHVRQVLCTRHGTEPNVQDVFFTRVAALEGFDKSMHPARASLRDRLSGLANDVAAPFEALIGTGAIDRWCDRMKELRNNIGHGDPIPLHQNAAELFQMSETAYWLFLLNLLTRARAPQAVFDHLTTVCE